MRKVYALTVGIMFLVLSPVHGSLDGSSSLGSDFFRSESIQSVLEDDSYLKILSIDGGGIRGIIPAMFLDNLEKKMGKPCREIFDVFAGTSTGGIIAAALTSTARDFSAEDVVKLYDSERKIIFDPSSALRGPRYKNDKLPPLLTRYFGDSLLSEASKPLLLTAYELERNTPFCLCSRYDRQGIPGLDFCIKDVMMATSAAPTYFPPVQITSVEDQRFHFIDGGVFANNPAERALHYAKRLYPHVPDNKIVLVSLGTGSRKETINYDSLHDSGRLGWASVIASIMMGGVSQSVHQDLSEDKNIHYFRFDSPLMRSSPMMDNISEENIANLKLDARDMYENHEEKLSDLMKLLHKE